MTRTQFEHTVRAAGAVMGVRELLVIGSQALHAVVTGVLPAEAERSIEVDVAPLGDKDGQLADLIDGAIGEASMFHETFGYYAHGVGEATAVLPDGWQARLIRHESPGTGGVVAWCLEPHDLWLSKAVAGREKDLEFCAALLSRGLVTRETLVARLASMSSLAPPHRQLVAARITLGS
jgi:hypothetical protein